MASKRTLKTNSLLQDIAKSILLMCSVSRSSGFYSGNLGAAIYLYHFSAWNGDLDLYSDLADELIMQVMSKEVNDYGYYDGISGLGWTAQYLNNQDFVDIPKTASLFDQIDAVCLKTSRFSGYDYDLVGTMKYYLDRIEIKNAGIDNTSDLNFLIIHERVLYFLEELELSSQQYKDTFYLNSLLHRSTKADGLRECMILIDAHSNLPIILFKAHQLKIYPEAIKKIARNYYHLFSFLFDSFVTVKNNIQSNLQSNRELLRGMLKVFNSLKSLADLLKIKIDYTAQESLLYSCLTDHYLTIDREHARTCAIELIYLLNLRNKGCGASLKKTITTNIDAILRNYKNIETLLPSYINGAEDIEIGLNGVSGLGMALLESEGIVKTNWKESFFII